MITPTPTEIAAAGTRWRMMWAKAHLAAAKAKVKADLAATKTIKTHTHENR